MLFFYVSPVALILAYMMSRPGVTEALWMGLMYLGLGALIVWGLVLTFHGGST
jgi:hypothetical protein